MVDIDKKLDDIFKLATTDKAAAQKMLEQSGIKEELPLVTDRINWLTDLQTKVGQEETVKMLSLIKMFDNFMIGAMALAIMLAGSIAYAKFKDKKQTPTKTRGTKKPATKKPVKKPIRKKK
jgi:hypothetical protein